MRFKTLKIMITVIAIIVMAATVSLTVLAKNDTGQNQTNSGTYFKNDSSVTSWQNQANQNYVNVNEANLNVNSSDVKMMNVDSLANSSIVVETSKIAKGVDPRNATSKNILTVMMAIIGMGIACEVLKKKLLEKLKMVRRLKTICSHPI